MKYKLKKYKAGSGAYKGQMIKTAVPAYNGIIDFDKFCELVSDNTTLNKGEVQASIYCIAQQLNHLLNHGYSVNTGDLGIWGVTLSSPQVLEDEELHHSKIKANLRYKPSKSLKQTLEHITHERTE